LILIATINTVTEEQPDQPELDLMEICDNLLEAVEDTEPAM
jgi:hypothetical protein